MPGIYLPLSTEDLSCDPTTLLGTKPKKAMAYPAFSACLIDISVYECKVLFWQPGSFYSEKAENVQSDLRVRLDKISAEMYSGFNPLILRLSWLEPERGMVSDEKLTISTASMAIITDKLLF